MSQFPWSGGGVIWKSRRGWFWGWLWNKLPFLGPPLPVQFNQNLFSPIEDAVENPESVKNLFLSLSTLFNETMSLYWIFPRWQHFVGKEIFAEAPAYLPPCFCRSMMKRRFDEAAMTPGYSKRLSKREHDIGFEGNKRVMLFPGTKLPIDRFKGINWGPLIRFTHIANRWSSSFTIPVNTAAAENLSLSISSSRAISLRHCGTKSPNLRRKNEDNTRKERARKEKGGLVRKQGKQMIEWW